MDSVKLNFDLMGKQVNGDVVAIAEVIAKNENTASSLLDDYLEDNYPEYGRTPDSHFEENGKYYFMVVE